MFRFQRIILLIITLLALTGQVLGASSPLSNGKVFKLEIPKSGIYQIDEAFINSLPNISAQGLSPKSIHLYGTWGGMLTEIISNERLNDGLFELPTQFLGNDNNIFEAGEKLVFYAEGASKVSTERETLVIEKNLYSTTAYVFLIIDEEANWNTPSFVDAQTSADTILNTYTVQQRIEEDKFNLLHDYESGQGSGKDWYMDEFSTQTEKDYEFDISDKVNDADVKIKPKVAVRSGISSSVVFDINNQKVNWSFGSTNVTDIEATYAIERSSTFTILTNDNRLLINFLYSNAGNNLAEAYVDFFQIEYERVLNFSNGMCIPKIKDLDKKYQFSIGNSPTDMQVWDVTDLKYTSNIPLLNQNSFISKDGAEQFFVAFSPSLNQLIPTFVEEIDNQDINEASNAEYIIIYPSEFENLASQLQLHRESFSGFSVKKIDVNLIYNEFSAGRKDLIAIRDYLRQEYLKNELSSVLLLGDGSFDERNIYNLDSPSNWLPVYETDNSTSTINSFPSDDIFGLLDEREGANQVPIGELDIAVGRLPIQNITQGQQVINKIIFYETSDDIGGDWQNRLTFVADDEDNNVHLSQANGLADDVSNRNKDILLNKIYFDAYEQVTTSGGQKYPSVTTAINQSLFSGTLVLNYMGHGGPTSLSQERVVRIEDIKKWNNKDKMPLMVTATCTFAGFDDPTFTSAGEEVILNPNGGAIALFTTVRSVFSSSNERLTRSVFENLFTIENDKTLTIGEILRRAKNSVPGVNSRKFLLMGDPGIRLRLPTNEVVTTHINNIPISTQSDTLQGLDEVIINGEVRSNGGEVLSEMQGELFVTVFDKPSTLSTRGQDERSFIQEFDVLNNIIYKGKVSVSNGKFEVKFVVPLDIDNEFGFGKISYFATGEGFLDANGAYENLVIGGEPNQSIIDEQGPEINLFMDHFLFQDNGTTNENPVLLVKLSDSSGINVSGVRIGHDIRGTIDEEQSFIMNEFYESNQDDFTSGVVRYPLFNLTEGQHQLSVTAWDVANNSSTSVLNFKVVNSQNPQIVSLTNFPNPFHSQTKILVNEVGVENQVNYKMKVYTMQGQLIDTQSGMLNLGSESGPYLEYPSDVNSFGLKSGIYYYSLELINTTNEEILKNKSGTFVVQN